ncbi:MAG TPA: alginate lyase family protein [Anaerolineae bacterium]|nr:alginate lyase family protein [Anaerolineae bacterium]
MPTLTWYVNRLKAMSPGEVNHRLQLAGRKLAWRGQIKQAAAPPQPVIEWARLTARSPLPLALPGDAPEAVDLIAEAQSYLRHEWHFFDLAGRSETPIDWHADPTSGIVAPRRFGLDLNHRDERLVGNVKVIWEKNRHHHLSVLAAAYALTRDERFAAEVANQLLDWVEQNPYLVGINWTHPLEQGIRLIAWVWCERWLAGSAHYERAFGQASPLWPAIYQHQRFIEQTYSQGSSANNHLIGEMAGLFIAAVAWPIFADSARWQALARRVLEQEIVKQTFPQSKLNWELAFGYHLFALEFFLLALVEAERAAEPARFSQTYRAYVRGMLEVIPLLTDRGGHLPRYGDSDEGMALQLQALGHRREAWLYHAGRALLGAKVPIPAQGRLGAALLGLPTISEQSWQPPAVESVGFADAGLYLLAQRRHSPREVFVLADAGPHGYLSLAAHAHADALSFTLSVGGRPILIDPGTYVYHTDWAWRQYFRGSRAHNTLVVDGLDQSLQAGPFLWSHKAETTVHHWQVDQHSADLLASHNGYRALGVIHRRRLTLTDEKLLVSDVLEGTGVHQIALYFHFAPECQIEFLSASELMIQHAEVQISLALPPSLQVELHYGSEALGWFSPGFGRKTKAYALMARTQVQLPTAFESIISFNCPV